MAPNTVLAVLASEIHLTESAHALKKGALSPGSRSWLAWSHRYQHRLDTLSEAARLDQQTRMSILHLFRAPIEGAARIDAAL